MRKIVAVLTVLTALVAAALVVPASRVQAQTRDIGVHGEMLDRIAAVVNDGLVLKSELDAQMEAVTKRLQEQKVELPSQSVLRQQVLDRLILQEIQAQRAKRVGLTISDEQLNGALQEIAQRNKIPFDQLPTALQGQGVDYKQYRESMRKELTLSTLRQRDVIAHINVTPHELDQYLARQQTAAANDEFNVSHILLSLPQAATPEQLDEMMRSDAPPVIFDARPASVREKEAHRIKGALMLDLDSPDKVDRMFQEHEVVIYCVCPNEATAKQIVRQLQVKGFKNVRPLKGGLDAWEKKGFPVEAIPARPSSGDAFTEDDDMDEMVTVRATAPE